MTANVQDAIVLLGDSITQIAFSPDGLATRLADAYSRKMDVVNRGFGGYNTDFIIPVFEQCFPTRDEQKHVPTARLLVIWFGANDAALPPNKQHVPLARYEANLATLVRAVRDPQSPRYSPDTRVVLLTPPPVHTKQWAAASGAAANRTLERSRTYAEGAKAVAEREGVAVVDVWAEIWEAAGRDEDKLGEFLMDGLHLNGNGYAVVYHALVATIAKKHPELHFDNLQPVFPSWQEIADGQGDYRERAKKRSAFVSEGVVG